MFCCKTLDRSRGSSQQVVDCVVPMVQVVLLGVSFMVVVGVVLEWLCGGFIMVEDVLGLVWGFLHVGHFYSGVRVW